MSKKNKDKNFLEINIFKYLKLIKYIIFKKIEFESFIVNNKIDDLV